MSAQPNMASGLTVPPAKAKGSARREHHAPADVALSYAGRARRATSTRPALGAERWQLLASRGAATDPLLRKIAWQLQRSLGRVRIDRRGPWPSRRRQRSMTLRANR